MNFATLDVRLAEDGGLGAGGQIIPVRLDRILPVLY